jgi:hypothetical protein
MTYTAERAWGSTDEIRLRTNFVFEAGTATEATNNNKQGREAE